MLKSRIKYGLTAAICLALFIFYHNFFFFYLFLVVALMPFVSYFASKYVWKKTDVKASIKLSSLGANNDIPIEFKVENKAGLPIQNVKFRFTAENGFYPNEEIQEMTLPVRRGTNVYGWSVKSIYAGRFIIKGIDMSMTDYLGLKKFERKWDCSAYIDIMPAQSDVIMNVVENVMTAGDDTEIDTADSTADVTQVKELREYRPGDRLQHINWKVSAKHEDLFVEEFEREYNRTLTLLVELRSDSEEIGFLDELITAFYSSALKLIEMEIRFYASWYDSSTESFRSELVEEEDGLLDVMSQMFMMSAYKDFCAYEKYRERPHGGNDAAVYFTSPSFEGADDNNIIGNYKEKVLLICL